MRFKLSRCGRGKNKYKTRAVDIAQNEKAADVINTKIRTKKIVRQMSSQTDMGEITGFDSEKYRQQLIENQSGIKKYIDHIMEMRAKCAELEVAMTSFYNPELQIKLKICRDAVEKCECLMSSQAKEI